MTWEMDMRIMEKAAEERGRKEGRREGVDAFATAVQEKFNISKDALDALKAELDNSNDAVKA